MGAMYRSREDSASRCQPNFRWASSLSLALWISVVAVNPARAEEGDIIRCSYDYDSYSYYADDTGNYNCVERNDEYQYDSQYTERCSAGDTVYYSDPYWGTTLCTNDGDGNYFASDSGSERCSSYVESYTADEEGDYVCSVYGGLYYFYYSDYGDSGGGSEGSDGEYVATVRCSYSWDDWVYYLDDAGVYYCYQYDDDYLEYAWYVGEDSGGGADDDHTPVRCSYSDGYVLDDSGYSPCSVDGNDQYYFDYFGAQLCSYWSGYVEDDQGYYYCIDYGDGLTYSSYAGSPSDDAVEYVGDNPWGDDDGDSTYNYFDQCAGYRDYWLNPLTCEDLQNGLRPAWCEDDYDGDSIGLCDDLCWGDDSFGDADYNGICDDPNADDDGDGVRNSQDQCAGFDDYCVSISGRACWRWQVGDAYWCDPSDYSDSATGGIYFNDYDNDGYDDSDPADACWGDDSYGDNNPRDGICDSPTLDDDGDGVPNVYDQCWGDDTAGDQNYDFICDNLSLVDDIDRDGIVDAYDLCFGNDHVGDPDHDGVCDDRDDDDRDGTPNSRDLCKGVDALGDIDEDGICDDPDYATVDTDADGISDAFDHCLGDDTTGDTDRDSICDDQDRCPNKNDLLCEDAVDLTGAGASFDSDHDGIPDIYDICVGNNRLGDQDGDGVCGFSASIFGDSGGSTSAKKVLKSVGCSATGNQDWAIGLALTVFVMGLRRKTLAMRRIK